MAGWHLRNEHSRGEERGALQTSPGEGPSGWKDTGMAGEGEWQLGTGRWLWSHLPACTYLCYLPWGVIWETK